MGSKNSSSIVLRRELLRPPLKLLRELDVDRGPKTQVEQDRGRSLVAIREIRECFTISGKSNIVSKICSLREEAVDCKAFKLLLKLIALRGSSLVAESENFRGSTFHERFVLVFIQRNYI